ncbi:MAG TPA: DUF2946 family protein [Ferrovibrio sp.]|jgi:hypothetical protein|uniref:DUF2946 family protein n=1 Tax=Ferrovibrio sp. TaxID=1917215 RepID=UPI002ED1D8A9
MSTARPAQVAFRAAVLAAFSRCRIATMLALLALAMQGLLPLAHNAAMRAAGQAADGNGIEQIVICTALGLRTITIRDGAIQDGVPRDGQPADADNTSPKPQNVQIGCPLCHALGSLSHGLLPAGLLLALPAAIAALSFAPAQDAVLPPSPTGLPQARAPPLSH